MDVSLPSFSGDRRKGRALVLPLSIVLACLGAYWGMERRLTTVSDRVDGKLDIARFEKDSIRQAAKDSAQARALLNIERYICATQQQAFGCVR